MDVTEKRIAYCKQLHTIAIEKGITHEVIAQKTGFIKNNVTRMLSGKYPPSLDNLIKLADAIGVELIINNK